MRHLAAPSIRPSRYRYSLVSNPPTRRRRLIRVMQVLSTGFSFVLLLVANSANGAGDDLAAMAASEPAGVASASLAAGEVLQPGFNQSQIGDLGGQTRAWGLCAADFNGDGRTDLLSTSTTGNVHLFTANADGTFTRTQLAWKLPYGGVYALAAADFNQDGKQDFVAVCGLDSPSTPPFSMVDGGVYVYYGNGDGTFQGTTYLVSGVTHMAGAFLGDIGTDAMSVTAGDVDGDGRPDIVAGDLTTVDGVASIVLFKQTRTGQTWSWTSSTILAAQYVTPTDPNIYPYFPPTTWTGGYGLALGDVDGDGKVDLLVTDRAAYLYIYKGDGRGGFPPPAIRYDTISTRPYAYNRLDNAYFSYKLAIATADINGDGSIDFVVGGDASALDGQAALWLNAGNDGSGRPTFVGAGVISTPPGGPCTDALGLAVAQLNPSVDSFVDIAFGTYEGNIYGLYTNRTDTDGDGIIDIYDNAPTIPNAPRIDMNTDGSWNYRDQLDNDSDGVGDPADADDDNDSVPDLTDNCPCVANLDQTDSDGDGVGDACDPLNDNDSDGDGIPDGPLNPTLFAKAQRAKGIWSRGTTHFIVRIDALGRQFQNEFTQTMADAAILTPQDWATKKFENYNGIGDDPATAGYQVPSDLAGGKNVPVTLAVIPKILWNAFGDPDPIQWMNNRIGNPNLELAQHGTYHANLTPYGDWASMPDRNWYSSEMSGFTFDEMFQYLRIGKRTLLGDYLIDPWIVQSGATSSSPKVNWALAANPLISFVPPFDASDAVAREAVARLGYVAFSASYYEETNPICTPEGSHHEQFDQFGVFHASADLQVNPRDTADYAAYLDSITQVGQLNTWLIEEVEWSSRYCNDTPRLDPCASAPDGINRENNMVDPGRWAQWVVLLDYVTSHGVPMTMGDYALAMAFDNAPTVPNPAQTDSDHNGIGDVIDRAVLVTDDVILSGAGTGTLQATLTAQAGPIAGQTVTFTADTNGDGTDETLTGTTNASGVATVAVSSSRPAGSSFPFVASWDGVLIQASDTGTIVIPDATAPRVRKVEPALVTVQSRNQALSLLRISFDKVVQILASDVTVVGLVGGARNDFTFAYDSLSSTATLTYASPLDDDTYLLTVSDSVKSTTNLALDGETDLFAPVLPSGDGTPGGQFQGLIYRLVSDANQDRAVDVSDLLILAGTWDLAQGDVGFDPRADFNVDNAADVVDLLILASRWGQSIPSGLAGDANQDRAVDVSDLLILAGTWGLAQGTVGFDPRADFNVDSVVDAADLLILASHWGQSVPSGV
jgi:hypothetical protein